MVGRTQNATKIFFFSYLFFTSIRIFRSRVVINYVCVYQHQDIEEQSGD